MSVAWKDRIWITDERGKKERKQLSAPTKRELEELTDRLQERSRKHRLGVPDAASIAPMRFLQTHTGIRAGGSTGTNLYGALRIACEMRAARQAGSIVTLMCDPRERYVRTYADDRWLAEQGLELDAYLDVLDRAWTTGEWTG